ncbi:MAG: hypothetical protein QHH06_14210 [Clostridiales bacterium]|nr:hypothetical protein [Eubacteriales bacterium]MDH7567596.1 hypothetical protein [Clostridiales bacterium]
MVSETNFIVRQSGRKEKSYYIDYLGAYKITDISKIVGIEVPALKEKYLGNGAVYDEGVDLYYFDSIENAKKTISDILRDMKAEQRGKLVFLTEAEVEYIRKALIYEGANNIHVQNKIKDAIFKKLNS